MNPQKVVCGRKRRFAHILTIHLGSRPFVFPSPGAGSVSSRSQSPHPHWHSRKAVGLRAGSSGYTTPNIRQLDKTRSKFVGCRTGEPSFSKLGRGSPGHRMAEIDLTNGKFTNPDQVPNGFCPTAPFCSWTIPRAPRLTRPLTHAHTHNLHFT